MDPISRQVLRWAKASYNMRCVHGRFLSLGVMSRGRPRAPPAAIHLFSARRERRFSRRRIRSPRVRVTEYRHVLYSRDVLAIADKPALRRLRCPAQAPSSPLTGRTDEVINGTITLSASSRRHRMVAGRQDEDVARLQPVVVGFAPIMERRAPFLNVVRPRASACSRGHNVRAPSMDVA